MKILTPFKNSSLLTALNNDNYEQMYLFKSNESRLVENLGETITLGLGAMMVCNEMIRSRLCYVEGDLYFRNVRCRKTNPWVKDSNHYTGLLVWFRNSCYLDEMTTKDVKAIIEFGLLADIIPQKSKQEFEELLEPWRSNS